jgi:hypothetical protein
MPTPKTKGARVFNPDNAIAFRTAGFVGVFTA